jgi:hypothetical protein
VTRSDEPANENSTSLPGLSVLNCSPMAVKDFFSDAAAKTISFPPPAALLVADDEEASFDDGPHPLTTPSVSAAAAAAIRMACFRPVLPGFQRSRWWL